MIIRAQHTFLLALLVGCSATVVEHEPCAASSQCRDAFGTGAVCGDEGFCEIEPVAERCTLWPADLALPLDPAQTILFGTLFDHSLETHTGRYRSAELALSQANQNGGLDGVVFAAMHCDNREGLDDGLTKDEATVELGVWLSDRVGVSAVIGPSSSSRAEATYSALADQQTLLISPSATSPSLTDLDGLEASDEEPGLLWRTAPPDSLQGKVIAEDMLGRGSADVSVIYQTGAYGDGLETVFTSELEGRGGAATGYPFSTDADRSDAIINAVSAGADEVLFISSDPDDISAFLNSAALLDSYEEVPLFLTDSARNADVLVSASGASALFGQIRGTAPSTPAGAVYDAFQVSYASEYAGEDVSLYSYTAHAYDAAWMLAYGSVWALYQEDGISAVGIARGLRRLSLGEEKEVRPSYWNTIKANLSEGQGVDIVGASGALDYDSATEETTAPIDIWRITTAGDDFEVIDTIIP